MVPVQKCTLQTGRMLEHCLKEHKRQWHWEIPPVNSGPDECHCLEWSTCVVSCLPYYQKRWALEAWHSHMEHQTMNRVAGPLPSVYNPLIHWSCPWSDCAVATLIQYWPTDISRTSPYRSLLVLFVHNAYMLLLLLASHSITLFLPTSSPSVYVYTATLPVL